MDVTHEVSRKFGELRADQLDRGQPVPELDLLSAATALIHDLTLVTHNTRDFSAVAGLRLDDWLAT